MKLRQLISELTSLAQQPNFDPDGEVFISLRDNNGDIIRDLSISGVDWLWSDIFDAEDTNKLVSILATAQDLQ